MNKHADLMQIQFNTLFTVDMVKKLLQKCGRRFWSLMNKLEVTVAGKSSLRSRVEETLRGTNLYREPCVNLSFHKQPQPQE